MHPLARRRTIPALVVGLFVIATTQIALAPTGIAAPKSSSSFDEPVAIAASGSHVWVANVGGNSVTELDSATGKIVRVINAPADGIKTPVALAATSTNVWVANDGVRGSESGTGSLTELNARNGSLVRVKTDQLDNPSAIAVSGNSVWITNQQTSVKGSVTVVNAATGVVTRVIHSASDHFVGPVSVVSRGGDVWVASSGGNNPDGNGKDQGSATELNAVTGSVMRVVDTRTAQFDTPTAMVFSGQDLWIANLDFSSIVELNASTGALVRFITASSLDQPLSMAVCGPDVWVADYFSNSVTELLRSNGKVVRVVDSSLKQPGGIACSGGHVWVTNGPRNSVTELQASNGSLVRVIK
jgi:DNA-binding beta-propeller fold protein YncE